MAATTAGARLTEAHRLAQARLGAQTVAAMVAIWPLLDPEQLDATFDRWASGALPVIQGQRSTSARLAANYLQAFKALELGAASTVPIVLAETATAESVLTSLLVTGPISMKKAATRGVTLATAVETAQVATARSAMRHVLDGGRSTIVDTVRADRQATGWARATSGKPCAFCAMVASRGIVYRSEDSASFQPHDGCSCSAEPAYRPDAALPAGSDRWKSLYDDAKAADGDTTKNFRALVEAA